MRRNGKIFAFLLGLAIFLQSGAGVWAAETKKSPADESGKETQAEEDAEDGEESRENTDEEEDEEPEEDGLDSEDDAKDPEEEDEESGEGGEPKEDMESEEDSELQEYIEEAQRALKEIAGQNTLMALVYLCDSYTVRKTPDTDGEAAVRVPSGTTVLIKNVGFDGEYNLFYQVSAEYKGTVYNGYIERSHLAYSNELLIEWENNYFPQMAVFASDTSAYPDVEQFPASYRDRLMRLKLAHPNWIFVRQNTGLEWKDVVSNEDYKDRNLISSVMKEAYRDGYHSPGWYYASEAAVKYYLDPRNFLDEVRVFQFEQLTYNPSYHTRSAVQNILNNTFMKGELPGAGMTYADAFFQTGVSLKVSPFHLACRVYQEQGEGKSALISGKYDAVPEYKGYYNYFNIGAAGTTVKQVVETGLAYAVKAGWNTPYAAIRGGAGILSKNYILRGQDTLYLQKFDVDRSDGTLYTHQYMQNIMAPYSESQMVKNAYSKTGSLDNSFVFKIPVYENMPSTACPVPGGTSSPSPSATATVTPTATATPTATPTVKPSATPSATPTVTPSATPSATPTGKPSATPSATPTVTPSEIPSATPTGKPSEIPSATPTVTPSATPVATPTGKPTKTPGESPSESPEATPSGKPKETPAATPTGKPTKTPAAFATSDPTAKPAKEPAIAPVEEPTAKPAEKTDAAPTRKPSQEPAISPTAKPSETAAPSAEATAKSVTAAEKPTATAQPTAESTAAPAAKAAQEPTAAPTEKPAVPAQEAADSQGTSELAAPPVSVTENTNSSGVTVAASTPKPHTASKDKDVVRMDMSKTGMIYAETLKQIREQQMQVELKVNDEISWSIDGSRMESGELGDINLGVTLEESQIPEKQLKMLAGEENCTELSLAHDGEFGFTIVLCLKLENAKPGQYANLFYYNKEAEEFEFMCASPVSSAGTVTFEFRHASDYVIIVSDTTRENLLNEKAGEFAEVKEQAAEAMAQAKEELPAKEPGRAAGIIVVILLASAAVGIGAYLIFKKDDE